MTLCELQKLCNVIPVDDPCPEIIKPFDSFATYGNTMYLNKPLSELNDTQKGKACTDIEADAATVIPVEYMGQVTYSYNPEVYGDKHPVAALSWTYQGSKKI